MVHVVLGFMWSHGKPRPNQEVGYSPASIDKIILTPFIYIVEYGTSRDGGVKVGTRGWSSVGKLRGEGEKRRGPGTSLIVLSRSKNSQHSKSGLKLVPAHTLCRVNLTYSGALTGIQLSRFSHALSKY